MKRLVGALALVVPAFVVAGVAFGAQPSPTTFVAVASTAEEVPGCPAATNAARGNATFHVRNEATGLVEYKLVANNLPGDIVAAHIHVAPKGVAGPVVQPLPPTPGAENGVIAVGSFVNPALVAAIQANPDNYYVNVHTNLCPPGAIRGQLGDHGPGNN